MRIRRSFKLAAMVIVVSGLLAGALAWWAAAEISAPSRRPLQGYHAEFLENPSAHGVHLARFVLADGTPCLLAEPGPDLTLGARGKRVRDQLAARNLVLPAPGAIVGTLVLVHGRKGRKEDYLLIGERLCAAGFRCLIPDLPGHGEHPVSLVRYGVGEADLPGAVLTEAAAHFGFEPQPAGLMGISMGGSVAVHAAAKQPDFWKALVVISSFDAFQPVILHQASSRTGPWLGGLWAQSAGWIYERRTQLPLSGIQPAKLAANLIMPTLIAHGTEDRVVPIDAGRRLYAALPEKLEKQWIEIPGADHDNVLITDFPIYASVAEWMLRHVKEVNLAR